MDTAAPGSKCQNCARWSLYQYSLDGRKREGWRCVNGVVDAGRRKECPSFLREVGSEAW